MKLKAERRYGELLGKPEHGGNRKTDQVASRHLNEEEKTKRKRARKVAAVPQAVFDDYIEREPKPSREGLLRLVAPQPRERKRSKDTTPPEAVKRLRQRIKQVSSLDARVRPRWTLEDVADVEAVLKDQAPRKKYAGKRIRELAAKRRQGHQLASLQYRMVQLIGILESVDVEGYDLADADDVATFHDDLVELQVWMERSIGLASARLDDAALERKIRKLRDRRGGTEHEQREANRLADKLERRRRESHLAS